MMPTVQMLAAVHLIELFAFYPGCDFGVSPLPIDFGVEGIDELFDILGGEQVSL
jgi:hypothetical protein